MNLKNYLPKLFPFKNLDYKALVDLSENLKADILIFEKGQVVISAESKKRILGFVMSGECSVEIRRSENETTTLNTLTAPDSFGILTVFSDAEEFPTAVKALKRTKILAIDADSFKDAVRKHPEIAINVISFLSEKVCFLNNRIATFSGKSVEDKLSHFLLRKYKENGREFPFSCTKAASALGVGRASLYRALDSFTEEGLIRHDSKTLVIICPEGLERKIK